MRLYFGEHLFTHSWKLSMKSYYKECLKKFQKSSWSFGGNGYSSTGSSGNLVIWQCTPGAKPEAHLGQEHQHNLGKSSLRHTWSNFNRISDNSRGQEKWGREEFGRGKWERGVRSGGGMRGKGGRRRKRREVEGVGEGEG